MLTETECIDLFASVMPRAESSRNKTHETDAELVEVGLKQRLLAVTTDCVTEEAAAGLYEGGHELGWVAVVASLSDLAAVGAFPLGVLTSVSLPGQWGKEQRSEVARGIADALREHQTGAFGGDTNGGGPAVCVTALGMVDKDKVMRRVGARAGDVVLSTGRAGAGSLHALARLYGEGTTRPYRPSARLREGQELAQWITACTDTSDGLLISLDELAERNQLSVELAEPEQFLQPEALEVARRLEVAPLACAGSIHGDFELCFTVRPEHVVQLRAQAHQRDIPLVEVGRMTERSSTGSAVTLNGHALQTSVLRSLWERSSSPRAYLQALAQATKAPT